ncbi:hypothetical protein JYU34_011712 [Plutella xylostella]|uniref:Uncharacterized protein n=1 Tax=Plutella xylostella TaxID=51655 RepID=A0ABQ7QDV3_PLUXY|nr:hypothetical protein JYU34_011712 [Plutella xylostella]
MDFMDTIPRFLESTEWRSANTHIDDFVVPTELAYPDPEQVLQLRGQHVERGGRREPRHQRLSYWPPDYYNILFFNYKGIFVHIPKF